jgi:hypothetical protein
MDAARLSSISEAIRWRGLPTYFRTKKCRELQRLKGKAPPRTLISATRSSVCAFFQTESRSRKSLQFLGDFVDTDFLASLFIFALAFPNLPIQTVDDMDWRSCPLNGPPPTSSDIRSFSKGFYHLRSFGRERSRASDLPPCEPFIGGWIGVWWRGSSGAISGSLT